MAEKKRPLGFETSSMRIQAEYEEILKQLMAKKADWGKLLKVSHDVYKFASDNADKVVSTKPKVAQSEASKHGYLTELEHWSLAMAISMALTMIAAVGRELAECDVRISKIEKELKDLRRGLK